MPTTRISQLLALRIGLDSRSIGPKLLAKALERRCHARNLEIQAYERILASDATELQALVEEIVVSETWFFRDIQPFDELGRFAASRVPGTTRPLRLLSFPCSTGEEAYSQALALMDRGWPRGTFRVLGLDLSQNAIDHAQAGVYGARSLKDIPTHLKDRFFRREAGHWAIDPTVKAAVEFEVANLVDTPRLLARGCFDIVFCRNALIYLTAEARASVVATLGRIVAPGGLLVLGHAESLPAEAPFESHGNAGAFAFRRLDDPAPRLSTVEPAMAMLQRASDIARRQPPRAVPPAPKRIAPVPSPETVAKPTTSDLRPILDDAARLANLQQYDRAIALCEEAISRHGPSPSAYHLLGVIQQASGRSELAVKSLERAVYLQPDHHEALLALSLLAQRRRDVAAADRYRRLAERARSGRSLE